jgi:predicted RNase H-like nuclease (RuvC/YqgF family)
MPLTLAAPAARIPAKDPDMESVRREKEALEAKNQELEKELQVYKEKIMQISKPSEGDRSAEKAGEDPSKNSQPTLSEIRSLRGEVSRLERTLRVFERELNPDPLRDDLPMGGSIRDHLSTTILGIGLLMGGCILGARYARWKDKTERTRLHF